MRHEKWSWTRTPQRCWIGQQGSTYADNCPESPGLLWPICIRDPCSLELAAPPLDSELSYYGPALGEPKEMYPTQGPAAVFVQVPDDLREEVKSRCRVWVCEEFT